jgi:Xaa-Pro aminopeptidase
MKFLDFSVDEYKARYARVQQLMQKQNVSALVLSDASNLIYVTGYRTILFQSKFRPFFAIVPAQGDPVLVLPNLEVGDGRKTSWVEDIRGWGKGLYADRPDAFTIIREVADQKGFRSGRVGLELGVGQRLAMTFDQYEQLREIFSGAQFVNAADIMWQARVRKSPQEIAYLRTACRATDAAFEAAVEAAREGVTETELQRVLGVTMMEHGADAPGFLVVASGPDRYDMLNPYASSRALRRGDMLNFDIGAVYKGYWGDLTRGIFIGEATKRQREFYEAESEIFNRTLRAVKPGVAIQDVDEVAERTIKELGYEKYMLHRTGHALGLDVHEIPSVAVGDTTIMEPGMVFTIEPGIYDFAIGAFRLEDTVVVTDTGFETLTNCTRELIVR